MKKLVLLLVLTYLPLLANASGFLTSEEIIGGEEVGLVKKSAIGVVVRGNGSGNVTCPKDHMIAGLMIDTVRPTRGTIHWRGGWFSGANMVYCDRVTESSASGCRGLNIRNTLPIQIVCVQKCG